MVNGLLPAISATTYGLLPASTIFDMKEPRAEYHVMFSLMRNILHAFVKVCERRVEICLTRVVFLELENLMKEFRKVSLEESKK